MSSSVSIRDYSDGDFAELLALEQQAFIHPQSDRQLQTLLKPPGRAWVAEVNQQLLGFALVRVIADEAELLDIAIEPAYQGKQVAELLLEVITQDLMAGDVSELFLEVRASNARAIGFYLKQGFQKVGVRKNYYDNSAQNREDALLMRLALK